VAILVRLPFCSREVGLPVLARLHLPGKGAWPGMVETAAALVRQLALAFPGRLVHVVADAAYQETGRNRGRSGSDVYSLSGLADLSLPRRLAAEEVGQAGRRDHRVLQHVEVPAGRPVAHGPDHGADHDQHHGGGGRAGWARVFAR